MSQFHGKCRKEGRTEGQTLIHRTLPATDGGPKKMFALLMNTTRKVNMKIITSNALCPLQILPNTLSHKTRLKVVKYFLQKAPS